MKSLKIQVASKILSYIELLYLQLKSSIYQNLQRMWGCFLGKQGYIFILKSNVLHFTHLENWYSAAGSTIPNLNTIVNDRKPWYPINGRHSLF